MSWSLRGTVLACLSVEQRLKLAGLRGAISRSVGLHVDQPRLRMLQQPLDLGRHVRVGTITLDRIAGGQGAAFKFERDHFQAIEVRGEGEVRRSLLEMAEEFLARFIGSIPGMSGFVDPQCHLGGRLQWQSRAHLVVNGRAADRHNGGQEKQRQAGTRNDGPTLTDKLTEGRLLAGMPAGNGSTRIHG